MSDAIMTALEGAVSRAQADDLPCVYVRRGLNVALCVVVAETPTELTVYACSSKGKLVRRRIDPADVWGIAFADPRASTLRQRVRGNER